MFTKTILSPNRSSMLTYCIVLSYIVHLALSLSINLADRGLMKVPNDISIDVTRLHLEHNDIRRLEDDSFRNYPKLILLDLNHNQIEFVAERAFLHTPKLTSLRMQSNKLYLFPNPMLLPKLKSTKFNNNRIRLLPQKHISSVNLLQIIAVPGNMLTSMPNLSHLSSIHALVIHKNNLTTIPDCYDLPLTRIDMAFNPLVRDKALCWIRMWPFNTLRPRQNGRHFPDDIFKRIFLNENVRISM